MQQQAVKLVVGCLLLLQVVRQALVDLMLNWKPHDLFQIKGQIPLLSITSISCPGNMIMLCVRSCHKMSFGSRYSIKRPSNSLLVEQKRINLSVTSPNAFLKSACGFSNFCSYTNCVGKALICAITVCGLSCLDWPSNILVLILVNHLELLKWKQALLYSVVYKLRGLLW